MDRRLRQRAVARRSGEYRESSCDAWMTRTLWRLRTEARQSLVEYARQRCRAISSGPGRHRSAESPKPAAFFDSNTLTLGFARRFATYKRPNLLLHDPERLMRILTNPQRPVQLDPGRQGSSAGLGRAGDDPAVERIHAPSGRAWPCRFPERLRHAADAADWSAEWTCGSTRRAVHGRRAAPAA